MYESIFETGVWLDYSDRERGSVCVSVVHGRGGEPPHGVAMATLVFPSNLHLHPQMTPRFPGSPWPNLRTSSETFFVVTVSSMPMRQGKLATGPDLLNGCPDRKNKTHSSTFI